MKIVDVEKLKEKYKIEGLKALKENKINEAIVILNKWHYCYATYRNEDKYTYDYEILNAIKSIVNPLTVHSCNSHKIRLGFLLFGANHQNSVLIKINLNNKIVRLSAKISLKDYVDNFLKNNC